MSSIFFATDVHGSEICWKKFINAGKFYNVDAIILGGDMTGKALVPFVESGKGTYRVSFLEQEMTLQGDDIERTKKMISDRGYYPIYMTQDRFQELSQDSEKVHQLFVEEVVKTAERWVEYAEERLRQSGIKCFICPGNDDMFELDEVFANSSYIELTEGKVVDIDGTYTMISTGWSNPTPWETHRECSEEELDQKIEAMIPQVPDLNKCIFNFHAPPYGSGLDEAPELDAELRPRYAGRSLIPVGSTAVKKATERYQPPLGLFGHIHEGKGVKRIGHTICINPGSSYEQSMLLGVVIQLKKNGIGNYILTAG